MDRITKWIDERIDLLGIRQTLLDRKMPGGLTWWHTLGSATLAVFMVQAVTGTVLAMYYAPSPDHAYDSIRYLEHSVASGAILRGIHHWGASAMVVLVVAHAIRVFTMGAYKYPREINWLLGVALLGIVLGFGFTGYLLPWDQKAYWATQVGTNIAGTTPIVGAILVKLLRGGAQLGVATLSRFYALHVLLLPALLAGIALLHLTLVDPPGHRAAHRRAREGRSAAGRTTPSTTHYYKEHYAASKGAGVRFWPDIVVKDAIIATGDRRADLPVRRRSSARGSSFPPIRPTRRTCRGRSGTSCRSSSCSSSCRARWRASSPSACPARSDSRSCCCRSSTAAARARSASGRWRAFSLFGSCSAPWRCSSARASASRSRPRSRPRSGACSTRRNAPVARCSSASSAAAATSSPARAAPTARATRRTRPI